MTTTRSSLRRVSAEAARRSRDRDGSAADGDAARAPRAPRTGPATIPVARMAVGEGRPEPGPDALGTRRSIVIERVAPEIDGGRHAVKRVVGDQLLVTADIFADGHDLLDAVLLLRSDGQATWSELPMRLVENDRWSASAPLSRFGRHRYTIEAWRDAWGSWREGLIKKVEAKVPVATELAEGRLLLDGAMARAQAARAAADLRRMREALLRSGRARSERTAAAALAGKELLAVVRRHPDRSWSTRLDHELPLMVDRERAHRHRVLQHDPLHLVLAERFDHSLVGVEADELDLAGQPVLFQGAEHAVGVRLADREHSLHAVAVLEQHLLGLVLVAANDSRRLQVVLHHQHAAAGVLGVLLHAEFAFLTQSTSQAKPLEHACLLRLLCHGIG